MSPTSPPKLAAPPIVPHSSPKAETAPAAATAKPSPARPSNPALLAHSGNSGFGSDVGTAGFRRGGRFGADADIGVSGFRRGGRVGAEANAQASATAKTGAVQQLDRKEVDKVFTDGAKLYEGILKTLGVKEIPKSEDPATRLTQASALLDSVLKSDSSLGSKITPTQFAETEAFIKALSALQPQIEASGTAADQVAFKAAMGTGGAVMSLGGGGGGLGGDHEPPGYFGG